MRLTQQLKTELTVVLDYLKQITFPFHISHHPNFPLVLKLVVLTFKSFWYLNGRETLYLQIVTLPQPPFTCLHEMSVLDFHKYAFQLYVFSDWLLSLRLFRYFHVVASVLSFAFLNEFSIVRLYYILSIYSQINGHSYLFHK